MAESSDALRRSILQLLRLLSSFESQVAYDVPAEWFCTWFDDQYHPESDLFQSAFTFRERAILAAFHQTFDRVSDSFPDPLGRAADLQARPEWRALSRAAMDTLRHLGEDSA